MTKGWLHPLRWSTLFACLSSAFSAWSVYIWAISMSKLAPVYKSGADCSVERFKLYGMHFKMPVFVQTFLLLFTSCNLDRNGEIWRTGGFSLVYSKTTAVILSCSWQECVSKLSRLMYLEVTEAMSQHSLKIFGGSLRLFSDVHWTPKKGRTFVCDCIKYNPRISRSSIRVTTKIPYLLTVSLTYEIIVRKPYFLKW